MESGGGGRMGGVVRGNEFRVIGKKKEDEGGKGVHFCTPPFSLPLPLFFFC